MSDDQYKNDEVYKDLGSLENRSDISLKETTYTLEFRENIPGSNYLNKLDLEVSFK